MAQDCRQLEGGVVAPTRLFGKCNYVGVTFLINSYTTLDYSLSIMYAMFAVCNYC